LPSAVNRALGSMSRKSPIAVPVLLCARASSAARTSSGIQAIAAIHAIEKRDG